MNWRNGNSLVNASGSSVIAIPQARLKSVNLLKVESAPRKTKAARPSVIPSTVGEALYWSYANLTMAYASKRHGKPQYQPGDYIIRNKNYYGILRGKLEMGSFFQDERTKMRWPGCVYCRTEDSLSIDHLIPQFSGGAHSADNLVVACQSCNSSKRKRDFLEWMAIKRRFPPLSLLRRYLKLAVLYCVEHGLMSVPLEQVSGINPPLPFSIPLLPYDYPTPLVLHGQPATAQSTEDSGINPCAVAPTIAP